MKDKHLTAFIEETKELLAELESVLIELEKKHDDKELIAKSFRLLHTIKGSSGMFGFDDISMFTHDIENAFESIRNGDLEISKEIIDLTLAAKDQIQLMLDKDASSKVDETEINKIIGSFRKIAFQIGKSKTSGVKKEKNEKTYAEKLIYNSLYKIRFEPFENIFLKGVNPILLIDELKNLGSAAVYCITDNIPDFEKLNPELCYLSWEAALVSNAGFDEVKDVFIFVEDDCKLSVDIIEENTRLEIIEDVKKQIIAKFERGEKLTPDKLIIKKSESEKIIEKRAPSVKSAGKDVKPKIEEVENSIKAADSGSSIRVAAEKLDELVNLVGELVTVQAHLTETAARINSSDIISIAEQVERITWDLRDSALNVRMIPIGATFSKFKRLTRDLSKELGKEVELYTSGEETELDKTVIEKLNDPLIHIIRNCIDHGVETIEERKKAGKNPKGMINLTASHSGANVIIEISDDGAGINIDKILDKAKKKGIIASDASLSEKEILNLLFLPGFSTAQKVTSVSGRGVGMDVVKRSIESLRGSVEIKSEYGIGSTVTLKIPLTLAIIEGLLIKNFGSYFIIPLSIVEECIEITTEEINSSNGRRLVNLRNEIIPYIYLREEFEQLDNPPEVQQIVIISENSFRVGLTVDKVVGQHQTVIKSLGRLYKNTEHISGATILGDGTVALILDAAKLVKQAEESYKENTAVEF